MRPRGRTTPPAPTTAVAILTGGRSQRMGRDKAKLQLGRRSFLRHALGAARATGWPVHIIRNDSIPSCGPLSGFYTAFERSRAEAILFMPCDMPLLDTPLLKAIHALALTTGQPVFTQLDGRAGFPCLLWRSHLPVLRAQIRQGSWSLGALARKLPSRAFHPDRKRRSRFANINTLQDYRRVLGGKAPSNP